MKVLMAIVLYTGLVTIAQAADCFKQSERCTAPHETRNINGYPVFRDCWRYEVSYECRSKVLLSDCQELRDRHCVQIGSVCIEQAANGTCTLHEQKYKCPDKPEKTTKRTVCDHSSFCQSESAGCFDTSSPPDQDFARAAVMMEAAREAGVYGVAPGKIDLFKGYPEECSIKVIGGAAKIKSCCTSSGGGLAFTNWTLLGAGMTAVGEAGRESVRLGSKYLYDSLYSTVDGTLMGKGLGAINSWTSTLGDGLFNPMFSYYGISFQFSFANGFQLVAFDPTSFALQIAVMLIQKWLACESAEQVMTLKRGQNLCVHTDSYCSKKVPIIDVCIEKKERHCCFNSKLAKLVNLQGKAQLGLGLEGCRGFTQAELQRLDFSQMDLSEFIADMMPKSPDLAKMTDTVRKSVQERVGKSYYEQ